MDKWPSELQWYIRMKHLQIHRIYVKYPKVWKYNGIVYNFKWLELLKNKNIYRGNVMVCELSQFIKRINVYHRNFRCYQKLKNIYITALSGDNYY